MSDGKRPTVVVAPDGNRETFSVETWSVTEDGHLSLFADGEEVATFHPHGWLEVYLLAAVAAS